MLQIILDIRVNSDYPRVGSKANEDTEDEKSIEEELKKLGYL